MTYKTGLFVQREPERRKIRDTKRDEFFDNFGLERLVEPLSVDIPHSERLTHIIELLKQTYARHEGDKAGLDTAMQVLAELGLCGVNIQSLISRPIKFSDITPEGMRRTHFDFQMLDWLDGDER